MIAGFSYVVERREASGAGGCIVLTYVPPNELVANDYITASSADGKGWYRVPTSPGSGTLR